MPDPRAFPAYLDTHSAIVGASGAGKTVTAKDQVEMMLDANRHVCIIDPTGAWYGLRSDASGEGPGFDIPIFGGPRGDVAITADQGEAIGAIIAGGVSAIVDISSLRTGAEQRLFVRDLARRLRGKPDGNFHLIVDEADEWAAQKPRDDYGFQVGEELIWMAKRGRLAGFVLTLVTQRPASIDKDVLTQAQTLFIHQLVSPVDQKPIVDYLKDHADKVTLATIKASLAGLRQGERWLYSPRLNVLERGVSPMPRTFDSSRTPAPGEQAVEPRMLASIDLGEIRKALAVERLIPATSSDEAAILKSWDTVDLVDELERRDPEWLKSHPEFRAAIEDRDHFKAAAEDYQRRIKAALRALGVVSMAELDDEDWEKGLQPARTPKAGGSEVEDKPRPTNAARDRHARQDRKIGPPATLQSDSVTREGTPRDAPPAALNTSARKMLEMLDRIAPARVTWASLATMVGNKARGGNFNAARKALRESGLIVEDGEAVRASQTPMQGMTRGDAIGLWIDVLTNPAPGMIGALDAAHPGGLTKEQLGATLGIAARGGHFNNGVAQLIRNGVAVDRGGVLHLAEPLPGEAP